MLKQYVIAVFLSFFSLTSAFALAETADTNIKTSIVSLGIIQGDGKYTINSTNDRDDSKIVADLNAVKTQNAMVKPETSNSEQSGWLLAFALFGFVMLSNRRGV